MPIWRRGFDSLSPPPQFHTQMSNLRAEKLANILASGDPLHRRSVTSPVARAGSRIGSSSSLRRISINRSERMPEGNEMPDHRSQESHRPHLSRHGVLPAHVAGAAWPTLQPQGRSPRFASGSPSSSGMTRRQSTARAKGLQGLHCHILLKDGENALAETFPGRGGLYIAS